MKSITCYYGLLITFLLLVNLSVHSRVDSIEDNGNPMENNRTSGEEFTSAINMFTWDIYKQMSDDKGNLFICPYSLSSALTMTYAGTDGDTAIEFESALHIDSFNSIIHTEYADLRSSLVKIPDVEINIANSLFPAQKFPVEKEFSAMMESCYSADLTPLDYISNPEGSRKHINLWVETQTRDKIQNLIPAGSVDALTVMVLVNAIYFKGDWASQFSKDLTRERLFTTFSGDAQKVFMMHQKSEFRYAETTDAKILEMPFKGDRLVMTLILPPTNGSLMKMESELNQEKLASLLKLLSPKTVTVGIPKFKIIWGAKDISHQLQNLGIQKAFSPSADFSRMSKMKGIHISMVIHKTFFEIDEKGAEAAAATGVVMRKTSVSQPIEFIADRPFLFFIRDIRTGVILFMGRMLEIPTN